MKRIVLALLLLLPLSAVARAAVPVPPSVLFGGLYRAVELGHVFADQKSFADAIPDETPRTILSDYRRRDGAPASR